jgi:6-phosphogluconolactonase
MMTQPEITIYKDADEIAQRAADLIIKIANAAIKDRGRFFIAFTGGSTIEPTYKNLAENHVGNSDWSKWFAFMSDERHVATDDSRSNFGMVRKLLLSRVPIPTSNIFPVPTELSLPEAAAAYEWGIHKELGDGIPVFDLILLGMGEDGHTASLFPGARTLDEKKALVTFSPPGTLPPPVDRITFTFGLINAGRNVLFVIFGEKKRAPLAHVLKPGTPVQKYPAAGVQPKPGKLIYLLDKAAAGDAAL